MGPRPAWVCLSLGVRLALGMCVLSAAVCLSAALLRCVWQRVCVSLPDAGCVPDPGGLQVPLTEPQVQSKAAWPAISGQQLSGELVSLTSFFPWWLPYCFFLSEKHLLANMAASCHQFSHRSGELPRAQGLGSGPQSCSACAPCSLICGRLRGAWVHASLHGSRSPPAFRRWTGPGAASGLTSRPRQPATSRPAPACLPGSLALGRFQCLKIALEETQVWSLRREMSLGRAANSTPRRTGGGVLWAGNTPRGRAPAAGGRGRCGRGIPHGGVPRQLVGSESLPTSPCRSPPGFAAPGFAARPRNRRLCQALG